jgi:phage FluMu protein Com
MAGKPPRRQVYTVACRCGAHAAIHIRTFGHPQVCRTCKISFTVGWKKDRAGHAVPVAVAQARKSAQRDAGVPDASPKLFLVCACGYRRPVPPAEAARNNRCPGCGKWMFVEKPASPRSSKPPPLPPTPLRPAPPPGPRPSEPPPPETPIGARAIRCPCGERLLVRLEFVGREARCPGCNRVLKLEGFRDPQTFVTQIRAVARGGLDAPAPVETLTPAAPAKPAPAKAVAGATQVACTCGQSLSLLPSQAGTEVDCPACGRLIQVQKHRDPQTLVTVIRPVFREAPPRPAAPAAAPPPPEPAPEAVPLLESLSDAAEGEDPEAFPPAVTPLTQAVICKCGEELLVGVEDAGRHVQCPSCGVLMEVEQVSGALRVRAVGKMDDGTWSLEDFA